MTYLNPAISCHAAELAHLTRERGFSLLEVLIALLVMSVGMLGIAGLQTISLRFNHQSYERTQATVLMSEMYEKIIANPDAARAGIFNAIAYGTTSAGYASYGGCPSACSTTELATYDINRWKLSIEDPRKLDQGQGAISVVPANPGTYDITIMWMENGLQMQQTMRARTLTRLL